MSNIYIQEPPTNGKVLLYTSVGDIDIELWSKEAPKACRNFVQLCMEGHYDDTIFHRVVPQFIAQCGDPTGTGEGGEAIYGKPFKDEFHSRLRFNRRGIVAMANAGPNDNGSQFFFTLAETPELQNKHTIFGKVAGNTIYNMIKLGEVDVGANERPSFPPIITKTKILHNPFEDIEARTSAKKKHDEGDGKRKKSRSKATKNFSLLSFGDEAEEDEVETNKAAEDFKHKGKSSHDLLDDQRLSAAPALEMEGSPGVKRTHSDLESSDAGDDVRDQDASSEADDKEEVMESIRKKLKKDKGEKDREKEGETVQALAMDPERLKTSKLEELKREAKRLRKELSNTAPKAGEELAEEDEAPPASDEEAQGDNDMVAAHKAERRKYKQLKTEQKKAGKSGREDATLALLARFQTKLHTAKQLAAYADDDDEEEGEAQGEGKGKEEGEEDEEDSEDFSWMGHQLRFDSSAGGKVLDANVDDVDRYEISDPRNPLTKRRREASKQAMKNKR